MKKLGRIIEEFIMRPLFYLSEAHGKLIVSISIICLCFYITRPMQEKIILPKSVEDTVGDIPIIEHFDDGRVEVVENPTMGGKVRAFVYPDGRVVTEYEYISGYDCFVTGSVIYR